MKLLLPAVALLFFTVSALADTTDIYQPEIKRAGVTGSDAFQQRRGAWGFGLGYQSRDYLESGITYNLTGRWFAGESWYLLGEYQYAPLNNDAVNDGTDVVLDEDENSHLLAYGVGYTFMQGLASFHGFESYPWQLAAELYLGEQSTGDSDGRYTALGVSWQVIDDNYWVGASWRVYQSNDQRLSDLGMNSGAQWALYIGSYF